jgi:hypothetical protein
MGFGQLFGGNAEMQFARICDFKMIIVHGHRYGSAGHCIISMTQGIGKGFACGARRITAPLVAATHQ